jgi:hypothetical protein
LTLLNQNDTNCSTNLRITGVYADFAEETEHVKGEKKLVLHRYFVTTDNVFASAA